MRSSRFELETSTSRTFYKQKIQMKHVHKTNVYFELKKIYFKYIMLQAKVNLNMNRT